MFVSTWTLEGVSNGLPHTTYRLPLGTPWMVLVYLRLFYSKMGLHVSVFTWDGARSPKTISSTTLTLEIQLPL